MCRNLPQPKPAVAGLGCGRLRLQHNWVAAHLGFVFPKFFSFAPSCAVGPWASPLDIIEQQSKNKFKWMCAK
jgi:hypothetical protein